MIAEVHRFFQTPVFYLKDKLTERQFLVVSSILVGITSGLAGVLLKSFVHFLATQINRQAERYEGIFFFAILPLIGILLTVVVVKYLLKSRLNRGSGEIVYAVTKKSSIIPPRETYAHVVTSGITVGFGGSVGLESPMLSTGAAIGSNYGSAYNLSYKNRTILLACGAAAGIAAAFNSPIAGVLFAVEVILAEVSASAFIPLIISAASGALMSKIILQEGATLSFSLQQPFNYRNLHWYIVLGVLAGFVSLLYTWIFQGIEHRMGRIRNGWSRAIAGGLLLFVLVLLFPPLFGEGYDTIKALAALNPGQLVNNSVLKPFVTNELYLLLFLGALVFLKSVAAAITMGSGGNGGNFGPSLFVGAYLGYVFAQVLKHLGFTSVPESNLTLVAMAGILSGVFYAPLTAIFLIAEITGGYELMIPLMIVSSFSVTIAHYFEPLSMESRKLAARHNLSVANRDHFLLSKLDVAQLIEKNFSTVRPEDDFQTLIKTISKSSRNQFPVLDHDEKLIGIVHMDNIRSKVFEPANHQSLLVRDLMKKPLAVIDINENLHRVLQKFDDTRQWNLPVTDRGKYVGFLSKSSILTRYRNELLESV